MVGHRAFGAALAASHVPVVETNSSVEAAYSGVVSSEAPKAAGTVRTNVDDEPPAGAQRADVMLHLHGVSFLCPRV